jgi:hypothetical protein
MFNIVDINYNKLRVRTLFSLLLMMGIPFLGQVQGAVKIGNNNSLYVDDTPFFPIGIYHISPKFYSLLKGKGINTVQAFLNEESLVNAKKYDLKILGILYPHLDVNLKFIADAVEKYKNDETILCWYLIDEPEGRGISPSSVEEGYKLVKSMDPMHPIYYPISRATAYESYKDYVDILAVDPYPVPDYSVKLVSDRLLRAITVVENSKPVWAVIQASPRPNRRPPLPEEVRVMVYEALIGGAKGILYYAFSDPNWELAEHEDLWSEIGEINKEIQKISHFILQGKSSKDLIYVSDSSVISDLREYNGKKIIMAANISKKKIKVKFALSNFSLSQVRSIFDNGVILNKGNEFFDTLEGYATKVYEIE